MRLLEITVYDRNDGARTSPTKRTVIVHDASEFQLLTRSLHDRFNGNFVIDELEAMDLEDALNWLSD